MDLDHRPHFRTSSSTGHINTTTTNELFICFTSSLSSPSPMKLTKSILSPGRVARNGAVSGGGGPVSLSSSLSRRLRSNGSLKGGASPFLTTTTGKRRTGGFENPEPSSPKVTCIGQVRVKTKQKVKQTRSLSKRRSGEISFRKTEQADNNGGDKDKDKDKDQIPSQQAQIRYSNASGGAHYHHQQQQAQECLPHHHRNQRWVHLPISICEALREFSCLFPCKSSCFSRDNKAENKQSGSNENGCGAVFARWLVSVNDGEGGKRREIELVVGGGDEEEEETTAAERVSRRHVLEDIEVKDDRIEIKGQSLEEEKARVSICIPPKNALLLMRCRSDPMKMASLANRFSWDAQGVCKNDNENIEEEKNEVSEEEDEVRVSEGNKTEVFEQDITVLVENNEAGQENLEFMEVGNVEEENKVDELLVISSEEMVEEKENEELQQEIARHEEKFEEEEEEVESNMSSFEALLDQQENTEHYEDSSIQDDGEEVKESNEISPGLEEEEEEEEEEEPSMEKENEEREEESDTVAEKDPTFENYDNEGYLVMGAQVKPDPETAEQEDGEENEEEHSEMENPENQESFQEKESQILPECLLLMMCEPKLSMEVSKETWVCSTDFIRWLPPRKVAAAASKAAESAAGDHEPVERRLSNDSKTNKPPVRNNNDQQQPRSSCSLPSATTAASMATMIEQKLVNAVGYEPFVLTRCKSEPMRTAAARLIPESCFWKSAVRKMEPHRRGALGVGAAGVGF